MAIKYVTEIAKELEERGEIQIPEGYITGEAFEKWLCNKRIMGYESRVIIVNRHEFYTNKIPYVYAEKIADIEMGIMYDGFAALFDKPVDYELYIDDELTRTDAYGDVMTYTDCETVIDFLEKFYVVESMHHRRLPMLLGLLKGINERQWDEIQIVHYGY